MVPEKISEELLMMT